MPTRAEGTTPRSPFTMGCYLLLAIRWYGRSTRLSLTYAMREILDYPLEDPDDLKMFIGQLQSAKLIRCIGRDLSEKGNPQVWAITRKGKRSIDPFLWWLRGISQREENLPPLIRNREIDKGVRLVQSKIRPDHWPWTGKPLPPMRRWKKRPELPKGPRQHLRRGRKKHAKGNL